MLSALGINPLSNIIFHLSISKCTLFIPSIKKAFIKDVYSYGTIGFNIAPTLIYKLSKALKISTFTLKSNLSFTTQIKAPVILITSFLKLSRGASYAR